MKAVSIVIFSLVVLFRTVDAHVALDYPQGGETFYAGQSITIQWHIVIQHDLENWDLYFSTDGGTIWEPLKIDIAGSQLEYNWTIPDEVTTTAKIKVVMDNTSADYDDISNNFTIEKSGQTSDIESSDVNREIFSFYPNPLQEINYYTLNLKESSQVAINLYTMSGIKQKTVLSKELGPGTYTESWNTSGFADGVYFLEVRIGNYSERHILILNQ